MFTNLTLVDLVGLPFSLPLVGPRSAESQTIGFLFSSLRYENASRSSPTTRAPQDKKIPPTFVDGFVFRMVDLSGLEPET